MFKDANNNNNKILLITNISNYISFPPQTAYKLIEVERSKDILQIQGLSIDGLNNRENTTYTIHRSIDDKCLVFKLIFDSES